VTPAPTPREVLRALVEWVEAYRRAVHPNRGGAPRDTGLTVAKVVAAIEERLELDGETLTQEVIAEDLGASTRWVRRVAKRAGGWTVLTTRAAEARFAPGSRPVADAATQRRSAS